MNTQLIFKLFGFGIGLQKPILQPFELWLYWRTWKMYREHRVWVVTTRSHRVDEAILIGTYILLMVLILLAIPVAHTVGLNPVPR